MPNYIDMINYYYLTVFRFYFIKNFFLTKYGISAAHFFVEKTGKLAALPASQNFIK